MDPKITIILLNWNGKADTLECLSSLEKLSYPSFTILIVDNGSTDGSTEAFQKNYPHIPVIETKKNLGFAEGNNVGIKKALETNPDFIFLLNNDTIVSPSLLEEFLRVANAHPEAAIFGSTILRYDQPDTIDHLGGKWLPEKGNFISLHQGDKESSHYESEEVDYVCGCSFFVRKELFETVGLLEAKFFLLWEESDFCFRALKKGWKIRTAPKAKVWHKISSSFSGGKPHMHYFWWRGRLLWIERNCSKEEKRRLYRKVLFKEGWKMQRHFLLKKLQYPFLCLVGKASPRHRHQLLSYRAGLEGIGDYLRKRFGNAPSWIFSKKK